MTWKFSTTTPLQGTFTFPNLGGNGTPFSNISTLRLANSDLGEQRVVEFINYLMGTDILIATTFFSFRSFVRVRFEVGAISLKTIPYCGLFS